MTNGPLHPKYRADIDGLRAIAVWAVILYHAFPTFLPGGFAGVDVFFVISGFLISTILFRDLDNGKFSLGDFYARRIRRIFPALSLVLVTVLGFGYLCLFPRELVQLGKHTASSAAFFQNIQLWKESGYFDSASETKPLLHIWSLGIEEQFYFIWPLLLWAGAKIGPQTRRQTYYLAVCFVLFVASFWLNVTSIHEDPVRVFYLPQYRIWELAFGGILAWLNLYRSSPERSGFREATRGLLTAAGFSLFLFVVFAFNKETVFPGKNALLPVAAAGLMLQGGADAFFNRHILSHKLLVWFGLISFPLYLWHWPILAFGRILSRGELTLPARLIAVLASIVLAWLTTQFIEKRFRFGTYRAGAKIAFLCSVVLCGGIWGLVTKKVYDRTAEDSVDEVTKKISAAAENCKKLFPNWAKNLEVGTDQWCRVQNTETTIALVGDSHSSQLYYGFVRAFETSNESVANFPASGAVPFLEIGSYCGNPVYRRNNHLLMNQAIQYLAELPSVRTIYLAHNPDCSFADGPNSVVDYTNPTEQRSEVNLRNGLTRTLEFLASKKKNVVIVLDNPSFPFDPQSCLSRGRIWDGLKKSCEVEVKSEARERFGRIVREVVDGRFSRVSVLDLATFFCREQMCSPMINERLLYHDDDHLNDEGSVFVNDSLLKAAPQ